MITTIVKTTPHPAPQRLVDVWASIVLKEIERQDAEKLTASNEGSESLIEKANNY